MIVKIIIGILLVPVTGWVLTLLPLPASLPSAVVNSLQLGFSYLISLNGILPVDTVMTYFVIFLLVELAEAILHLVQFVIKHINN